MSELLFGYLANSILRGAVVVGLLWLIELCCRRRLIFAGGRWFYLAALLLILLPFEQLATLRASTPLPVRHVELPVWSVALPPPEPEEAAPAAEAPDVQTAPSGTVAFGGGNEREARVLRADFKLFVSSLSGRGAAVVGKAVAAFFPVAQPGASVYRDHRRPGV